MIDENVLLPGRNPKKAFLTVSETAKVLGVSQKTVRKYIRLGILIPYDIMGKTRISVKELNEYIQKRKNLLPCASGIAGKPRKLYVAPVPSECAENNFRAGV